MCEKMICDEIGKDNEIFEVINATTDKHGNLGT